MFRVVIDDVYRDSAAESIAKVLAAKGPAEVVTLSQFMSDSGFRFNGRTGLLARVESAADDPLKNAIYNRVVNVSEDTASTIDGGARVLHPNIVLGAYASLLKDLPRVWGGLTPYPAAQMLPVNLQWKILSTHVPEIQTPNFVYEMNAIDPDLTNLADPLQKDPFDVFEWKTANVDPSRPHTFVVDKPSGYPVVSYFVGEAARVFVVKSGEDADPGIEQDILALMPAIREAFKAPMGECLFFVDRGRVIFAAFTRYMKSSVRHPSFESIVERGLATFS